MRYSGKTVFALTRQRRAGAVVLFCCCVGATCRRSPQTAGLVVEQVEAGGAAARAGLQPGDVLLGWARATGHAGPLRSPFDLRRVELEEAPLGPLTLDGRRGEAISKWSLANGRWKLIARPQLANDLLHRYQAGQRHLSAGRPEQAATAWPPLMEDLKAAGRHEEACWVAMSFGQAFASAKRWIEVQAAFAAARDHALSLGQAAIEAEAWEAAGDAYRAQGDVDRAEEAYRATLRIKEQISPEGLAAAFTMGKLGALFQTFKNDHDAAASWQRKALALRERLAPRSLETASTLSEIGAALLGRGDLEEAERAYRQALAIAEPLAPDGEETGSILSGLGLTVLRRGDWAAAEGFSRRALAISEALDPASMQTGQALLSLGSLALSRGYRDEAETFYARALALFEKLAPDSNDMVRSLTNLGAVAVARKDWDRAESLQRRALTLCEKHFPGKMSMATSLHNLGEIAVARGQLEGAEARYRESLAIKRKVAPDSLRVANTLWALGIVSEKRRDWRTSIARHEGALRIRSRLAPLSWLEAESLYALSRVRRAQGSIPDALRLLRAALDALEAQRGRLGSGDAASGLTGKYAGIYDDLIAILVEQRQPEEAFAVLERARARGLLAMLAERELAFADAPAELERERRQAEAAYDTTLARLGGLGAKNAPEEVETLRRRLDEDALRRAQVAWKIRAASPRLAALRNPEPLDFEAARSALDPGTVLLAYNVAEQRTHLFAVRSGADRRDSRGLTVFTLPLGEEALRQRVLAFRGLVEGARERELDEPLAAQAGRLFDDLVRPASRVLAESQRVLIVPDGPLHALSFAALLESRRPRRYFAESFPLHTAFSVTVYAELKSTRRGEPERAPGVLVAFGDPDRPATDVAGGIEAGGSAPRLKAIPDSREEVRRIANLFGPAAVAHVGADATEERARALGRGVRYVHFACHGLLDLRRPLDSALVLSLSPRQEGTHNGLLQAWEIFERLRLDADLVTLSACDTALGRELAGEGLIGLTRAFQYAGARSVLSSLWAVADQSTAELMESFYRELRSGKAKDEALQVAQVALIRRGVPSFHWAPFQITGDWQ